MSSIEEVFENEKAFMPFTVAGYPSKEKSIEIIEALINSGADIIELGIPFSDPMADGPTIMEADQETLENDFSVDDAFEIANKFQDTPIVLMAYANTLRAYGYEAILNDAEEAGINGLIVPDMPPEEYKKELGTIDTELKSIFLVAQNTPKERMSKIEDLTEGFVYLVSVKGTTGARVDFKDTSRELIEKASQFKVPKAIGFGISDGGQAAKAAGAGADGVIVGSALIDRYKHEGLEGMKELATKINKGVINQ